MENQKINFNNFKYSTNVSEKSLILLNFNLVEKEVSINVFSYFIYGFGFARCVSINKNINMFKLILYEKKRNLYIVGNTSSIVKECPWSWAGKCEWNSFYVVFYIPNNFVKNLENITIFNLYTSTKLDVTIKRTYNTKKNIDNLTICVPPLYWYNNFLQLFLFTEIWKLHGASHFIYYYYSVSENVMSLLKYYESKQIVTLIPYKSLPKSNLIDPNKSVYRYGHLTAINDCLQKRYSKYSTVIDVDEFLYYNETIFLNKENFYQYIEEIFKKNKKLSGILFSHHGLQIDTKNMKDDFEFLQKTYINYFKGPQKYIIKSNRIEIVDSHKPLKYMKYNIKTINFNDAFLLHLRANWAYKNNKIYHKINLISLNQTKLISDQFMYIKKILKFSKEFNFQTDALMIMNKCLSKWKMNGCKIPNDFCQKELLDVEKWIKSDDIYTPEHYLIL
ncbi:Domain of unknown function DUF23 domain-containing protein [Strongyloides ratti]|uniref:Glycosyltransferase family 92 protein n=1 Tax=Strongyloides ratti TaxID=34506 RepID=A0A090LIR8_STRRB|nr:Domain of unknown function DUF23 domain-containing protein [Strongyloides ratti]CEF68028.1 Domain of unknown function DUF23 domain-containing protein [Strongyloides ratti]